MNRRRALWVLGIAALALFVVEAIYDGRMQDAGGHGIIAFEVAFTHGKAQSIMTAWGPDGHDAAVASLWFDYLYLAAYGLFFWLSVRTLGDALARRGRDGFGRAARVIAPLALLGAACDALEDLFLLLQLGGRAASSGPPLAGAFASVKFACLVVVVVYLLAGLVALALARRSAPAR